GALRALPRHDRGEQEGRVAVRVAAIDRDAGFELGADGLQVAVADRLGQLRGQRLGGRLVVAAGRGSRMSRAARRARTSAAPSVRTRGATTDRMGLPSNRVSMSETSLRVYFFGSIHSGHAGSFSRSSKVRPS